MIVPTHILAASKRAADAERIAAQAMKDRQRLLDAIRDAVDSMGSGFPMTAQKILTTAVEEVLHGVG